MIRKITASAKRDVFKTLNTSRTEFGPDAHAAYKALIDRAILDLSEDARRVGVRHAEDLKPGVRVYHLRFSRKRVSGRRVGRPRHVFLFRVGDETVTIARLLHERMLFSKHL